MASVKVFSFIFMRTGLQFNFYDNRFCLSFFDGNGQISQIHPLEGEKNGAQETKISALH